MELILASKSPRRREILSKAGYAFKVVEGDFEEKDIPLSPEETAKNNALGKALSVKSKLNDKNAVVLGADTVVFLDGEILGKPTDQRHAMSMLLRLSGKTHSVVTGWAIVTKSERVVGYCKSEVTFNQLDLDKILAYVQSGLAMDKAGSYGVQDGYDLVKEYKGSLNNIIGLPIEEISLVLDGIIKSKEELK